MKNKNLSNDKIYVLIFPPLSIAIERAGDGECDEDEISNNVALDLILNAEDKYLREGEFLIIGPEQKGITPEGNLYRKEDGEATNDLPPGTYIKKGNFLKRISGKSFEE